MSMFVDARVDRIAERFLTPVRSAYRQWPRQTEVVHLKVQTPAGWPDGPYVDAVAHKMGRGPSIMLVHGWEGQSADMVALANSLVARGFTAWALDLPGHGASQGTHLCIPLAANALLQLSGTTGTLFGAVTHSYGGSALVEAMNRGLDVGRVALLAPPSDYAARARDTAMGIGLPEEMVPKLLAKLSSMIGEPIEDIKMARRAPTMRAHAMFTQSLDDPIIPLDATLAVVQAWPSALMRVVRDLGHRRILNDPATVRAVTSHLIEY